MSPPRRRWKPPKRRHLRRKRTAKLLDQFSVAAIERWAKFQEKVARFHWDFYNSLAYQRLQIADDITEVLLGAVETRFPFQKWQRVTRLKHVLEPLSPRGSLTYPGGRFNIGEINLTQFPPFSALYMAQDKSTALQEALSQDIPPGEESRALDFALAKPDSFVTFSLSGQLESIISLKQPAKLDGFIKLIKNFSMPKHLIEEAKAMGFSPPILVRDATTLVEALLSKEWRLWPTQFDVPHPSQIFGQLVLLAGIEGVLYPSKFGSGDCLAVFPKNFENSEAFVQLDDPAPQEIRIPRLDATTWQELI